jgi:hypothetical protein
MIQCHIPVILVATGCENERPMEAWVGRTQEALCRFAYNGLVATCFASGGPLEAFFAPRRSRPPEELLSSVCAMLLLNPENYMGLEPAVHAVSTNARLE